MLAIFIWVLIFGVFAMFLCICFSALAVSSDYDDMVDDELQEMELMDDDGSDD